MADNYSWEAPATVGGIKFGPNYRKAIVTKNDGVDGDTVGWISNIPNTVLECMTWNGDGSFTVKTKFGLTAIGSTVNDALTEILNPVPYETWALQKSDGTLRVWTGTVWAVVPSLSFGITDVRDFGAVGGDTGNQSSAIQAAINAATANGTQDGTVLLQPNATYRIADSLILNPYLHMFGYGHKTVLHYVGSDVAMKTSDSDVDSELKLRLDSFKVSTTTGTKGILLQNGYEAVLRYVRVDGFSEAGIHLYGTNSDREMIEVVIDNCQIVGGALDGILIEGSNRINRVTIRDTNIVSVDRFGVHVANDGASVSIVDCDIENTGYSNIAIKLGRAISIRGGYFETTPVLLNGIPNPRYNDHPAILVAYLNRVTGFTCTGSYIHGSGPSSTTALLQLGQDLGGTAYGCVVQGNDFLEADYAVDPQNTNGCLVGPNSLYNSSGAALVQTKGGLGSTLNLYTIGDNVSSSPTAQLNSRSLALYSNTGGIVIPSLNNAQRSALTPLDGMLIFYNPTGNLQMYISPSWIDLNESPGSSGAFQLPQLTTTQRGDITPVNGMMIYNTTTNAVQVYIGGVWTDI